MMAWIAVTGSVPRRSVSPGARSLTMACGCARLVASAGAIAESESGGSRRAARCDGDWHRGAGDGGQSGEGGIGEPTASESTIDIVAA
jgi:hypothetical protein